MCVCWIQDDNDLCVMYSSNGFRIGECKRNDENIEMEGWEKRAKSLTQNAEKRFILQQHIVQN